MTDQVTEPAAPPELLPPKLFKLVHADGSPPFAFSDFRWSVPEGDQPGEWAEVEGELVACRTGLHMFDAETAARWIDSRSYDGSSPLRVYEVEVDGEVLHHDDGDTPKWVARRARLVRLVGELASRDAEWAVVRSLAVRRYDRYVRHHEARAFAKAPAWIRSLLVGPGDRKLWELVTLLKAEVKLERARMEVARLSGRADTPNAKARRRALNNRTKQVDAYLKSRSFDPNSIEACAAALGVRLSKRRAARLSAVRAARLERAKRRVAVRGVTVARLVEMVKEAAA